MAVLASDLVFRLTETVGPSDTSTASSTASLGGFLSATDIDLGDIGNLFDDIHTTELAGGHTDYRCVGLLNTSTDATLNAPVIVWVSTEVAGGATVQIGIDTCAASPSSSTDPQFVSIAAEQTTPTGIVFSSPASSAGITVGALTAGQTRGLWFERVSGAAATSKANDGITIAWEGFTS